MASLLRYFLIRLIVNMERRSFTYLINVWYHTQVMVKPEVTGAIMLSPTLRPSMFTFWFLIYRFSQG